MKESELVARLQAGDATALKAVVYQYGGYVYTIVKAVLGGRMAEEDVEEVATPSPTSGGWPSGWTAAREG